MARNKQKQETTTMLLVVTCHQRLPWRTTAPTGRNKPKLETAMLQAAVAMAVASIRNQHILFLFQQMPPTMEAAEIAVSTKESDTSKLQQTKKNRSQDGKTCQIVGIHGEKGQGKE